MGGSDLPCPTAWQAPRAHGHHVCTCVSEDGATGYPPWAKWFPPRVIRRCLERTVPTLSKLDILSSAEVCVLWAKEGEGFQKGNKEMVAGVGRQELPRCCPLPGGAGRAGLPAPGGSLGTEDPVCPYMKP